MRTQFARPVRRIGVTDPIAVGRRYDYADAFEARLPAPDPYPPETWLRAGLDQLPGAVQRIVSLLGLRQAPADHVSDLRVVSSSPHLIHLETSLPLMHVEIVGRNLEPTRRMLTTVLRFKRPVLGRLAWTIIGPAHRWLVPRALTWKISTG